MISLIYYDIYIYIKYNYVYTHTYMYGEHTHWHVQWRRNETAGRIIIFTKKTERTNCAAVGIVYTKT